MSDAVIAAVGDYINTQNTNAANASINKQTRDFNFYMDSTKYRRSVVDLRRAGLNPMLAYMRPGGSTLGAPSPIPAQKSNAAQIYLQAKQLENMEAQNALLRAQKDNIVADTDLKKGQTNLNLTKETLNDSISDLNRSKAQLNRSQGYLNFSQSELNAARHAVSVAEEALVRNKSALLGAQQLTEASKQGLLQAQKTLTDLRSSTEEQYATIAKHKANNAQTVREYEKAKAEIDHRLIWLDSALERINSLLSIGQKGQRIVIDQDIHNKFR